MSRRQRPADDELATLAAQLPSEIQALWPEAQSIALAEQKARMIASGNAEALVLAADTIVVLDAEVLGKPVDDADARRLLRRLSGRAHRVVTGLALIDAATGAEGASAVSSIVRFRPLREDDMAAYAPPANRATRPAPTPSRASGPGCWQGLDGCFTNVVGLPHCETARLLIDADMAISPTWPGCRLPDGSLCPRQEMGRLASSPSNSLSEGRRPPR